MQWIRASEVVAGLILDGQISAESIEVHYLAPPYDILARISRDGGGKSEMLDDVGIAALLTAESAANAVDGNAHDYIAVCRKSAVRVSAGYDLRKVADKLERGEDADIGRAISAIGRLEQGFHTWTTADEVEPEPQIYVPSYYPPLDQYVGGYPMAGLTIVAGITGTGKTTFLIELARRAAKRKKRCAILTLEMTMAQIVYRMIEVDPDLADAKKRKNIILSDDVYDVDEVYAAATRLASQHTLHFIGVDYADMLVGTKEQSEAVMGRIYNSLSVLAKKIRIPVILVAQYRRTDGKIPTIEDIRYSGRAEQAASMILLLYNPSQVFKRSTHKDETDVLPRIPGAAHIIVGKTRYRSPVQPSSTGAIRVIWDRKNGRWGKATNRYPAAWDPLDGVI